MNRRGSCVLKKKCFGFLEFGFGIAMSDFNKNQPTTPKLRRGDTRNGIWNPNPSKIMTQPRIRIEYTAPFFMVFLDLIHITVRLKISGTPQ